NPASSTQLVNNLDLTVTKGADVYRGNVYGVGTGLSVTGGAYDNLNVEEGVRISAPATGIWTVRVAAPVVPFDPQAFGLVLTGGIGDAAGALALDRGQYGSTSVVELQVIDTNAGPTVSVDVTSTTEGTAETVVLTGGNGVFTGTLPLTPAEVTTGNGVLSVSHGDQITATYLDASPSATLSASATVSYQTPIITNVQAASAGGSATRITWDTDINATTRVYYGLTPALELGSVTETGAPFAHSVLLTGLTPGSTYYFDVESASLEGNVTRDDRGGAHYTFTAKPSGDVLMVFGTDEFERKVAWDSALMDGAYDYDVWSGPLADAPALGDLNGGLRSYRAVLWQPGLEQYPPFTDGAQTVLTDYLNGGGRLLVCGHDIAWAFGDPTSPVYNATRNAWLQNTLRTIWLQDPLTWSSIIGVGGDPISGAHTGGVAYTPIRDGGAGDEVNVNQAAGGTGDMVWLNNDASPDSIGFRWESGTPNGSGATAVWGGLPSRLATMYYEFTAMTPPFTSPSATRTAILDKTIQWLYGREKPTVTITAPNGGEIITTSSTNITWNETVGPSRAVASRKLEYSLDGGQSWVLIANGVGPSPYSWDLTSVPNSLTALVRIRNTDDGAPALSAQDASNAVFTLNRSGGDVLGPVVVAGSINASPNPIVRPNPATLNAKISEATTGGSTVTAAEWSFGNAPAPAGNGTAMTGAFGTVVVDVSAALNTTPFQTGPQKLWVRGQDANGNWGPATALDIQINGPPPVGVDETPTVAFLRQNTPNPFAGTTAIRFGLPHTGPVDLGIFDVAGRLVRQLVDAPLAAGLHTATWDRTDAQGVRVKPGIYYYRLITPTSRFEKRLVALN
ncbi:MAG TPA: FlgD immunoglobulin-like domain containing protein, partial [Candidatus Limnocylindria bacterium]|nr:FlgD immunoglobulin-like domain containing protein [Candidatus Limnocylindria bacterium]